MGKVLGIVYRAIETHLIHKAGLTRSKASTGAVTLIQRFGSALNLDIHFHMLFLDGVYLSVEGGLCFRRVKPPRTAELNALVDRISERVGRDLEQQGLQTLAARDEDVEDSRLVKAGGFSLHCGVAAAAHQRDKRERCAAISHALRLPTNAWR